MPLAVDVDVDSAVPPYEQVRSQLATQIGDGTLPIGTRLPPVRTLAEQLRLAVNTVARAYRELESTGLVETRGRAGTLVSGAEPVMAELRRAAERFAELAQAAGLDQAAAEATARAAIEARRLSR